MNKILNYTLNIQPIMVDGECIYVAKYVELEGCLGEGTTADEALMELNCNAEMWLDVRKEKGLECPKCKVQSKENFSGKLSLRLPKSLHKKISEISLNEGVSINQCIVMALSEYVGSIKGFTECHKQYSSKLRSEFNQAISKAITLSNSNNNKMACNYTNNQYKIGGMYNNGMARNIN